VAGLGRGHHRSDDECTSPGIDASVVLSNLEIVGQLAVSQDPGSVSRIVLVDLETAENMNGFQRIGICCLKYVPCHTVGNDKRPAGKLAVVAPPNSSRSDSREAEPTTRGLPKLLLVGLFRGHGNSRCDTNDFLRRARNLPFPFPAPAFHAAHQRPSHQPEQSRHQETQKSAVSQGGIRKKNLAAFVQEGNPKREPDPSATADLYHAEASIGIEDLVSSQSAIGGKKMVFHTQRKRSKANPASKSRSPGSLGSQINSGPPVSKIAINKESFQGPAPKKVTPQPNAFWTVKLQLVKRVR